MGATFELPVVIFFLAMFGIVSPRFLWKNMRYAILIIFIIVEIITPSPDIPTQFAFALPMLLLYVLSIGIRVVGAPEPEEKGVGGVRWLRVQGRTTLSGNPAGFCAGPPFAPKAAQRMGHPSLWLVVLLLLPSFAVAQQHFRGDKALEITREFVAIGPRPVLSPAHAKAEAFLREQFKHDQLEEDAFTAIHRLDRCRCATLSCVFRGRKTAVIVLATHYETNYPLRNIGFVGANDGGSTTGLLIEIANEIRGKVQDGYSVWLVFFDGEEAIQQWQGTDNTYGSRHLAAKWGADGTLRRIKAFLLADMLGDKDLDVQRETQSTPWLSNLVMQAARNTGHAKYFFAQSQAEEDDHIPFVSRGAPSIDIIDSDYGPHTPELPDGYHHTAQDTMDKISAKSLTIAGDVFLETIKLVDRR